MSAAVEFRRRLV